MLEALLVALQTEEETLAHNERPTPKKTTRIRKAQKRTSEKIQDFDWNNFMSLHDRNKPIEFLRKVCY